MFKVYLTSENRCVISRKNFRETILVQGRFGSVEQAYGFVSGNLSGGTNSMTIKYDEEIESIVYESCIPDIKQSDFINTDRYL